MQMVAADILGPLPELPKGNTYLLVVADHFTRWMEAYPILKQEAVTVAKILTNEYSGTSLLRTLWDLDFSPYYRGVLNLEVT